MPRRRAGASRPGVLARSSFAASLAAASALIAPTALFAQQTPSAPAPTVKAPTVKVGGAARALLLRAAVPKTMGDNNGVRVWVRGDGSGTDLRVRLMATGQPAATDIVPVLHPSWVSAPVKVTWTGWKVVLVPKSRFTLSVPDAVRSGVDLALPADAQVPGPASGTPDWSAIDTIALETTVATRASLDLDDIAWVTLDPQGAVTSATVVDDFEQGNLAAWTNYAAPAQKSAAVYGLATAPAQIHEGRVALKLDVTAPVVTRAALAAAARRTLAQTGKAALIWVPASRFQPILPTSLPPAVGAASQLALTACPEQVESGSFCVYSPKPLTNVTVALNSDLQGIGHVLKRGQVNIHVVKVWDQTGTGPLRDPDLGGPTPEILVKDDRAPLSGPAPAVRLTGNPVTDIPADSTKQFWLTVTVPRGTAPGQYVGTLLVSGQGLTPQPVRVGLNVLPLRLISASKQYAIDLRSRLDPAPAVLPSPDGRALVTDFVTKDALDAQLADIAAHGFHIATLYDSPATLWDAVASYQAAGMAEPYLYKGDGDPAAIEKDRHAHNAPAFVYYGGPGPVTDETPRMAAMVKGGLLATTYITRQADYDALQSSLELPIYNRDSDYPQQLLKSHGARISPKRDWWYWSAADDNPDANRLSTGYLLWRANLYGAYVPDYQTAFGTDPYDPASTGAPESKAAFRPQMLTYPAQGGVIDTLKWEAAREGVTDVRYLTTMYTAYRECKDAKIAPDLTTAADSYVKAFLDRSLVLMTDADYDAARARIAGYAVKLRATIDAYNKAHHLQ